MEPGTSLTPDVRGGTHHRFLLPQVAVSNDATIPVVTILGPLRAVGRPHAARVPWGRPAGATTAGLCHRFGVTQHRRALTFGPVGYIQGPLPVRETGPHSIGPFLLPSACEEGVRRLREVTVACPGSELESQGSPSVAPIRRNARSCH